MEHECVFALAFDRVDDLCIPTRAERGYHDGLCLSTCEYRRTVGSRQNANLDINWTDRFVISAIDSWFACQHPTADNRLFELRHGTANFFCGPTSIVVSRQRFDPRRQEYRSGRHVCRRP